MTATVVGLAWLLWVTAPWRLRSGALALIGTSWPFSETGTAIGTIWVFLDRCPASCSWVVPFEPGCFLPPEYLAYFVHLGAAPEPAVWRWRISW